MVTRENATLLAGFLVAGPCFAVAAVRGLSTPLGLGAYILAAFALGLAPQLYLCSIDAETSVKLRVRTGAFVTGYLVVMALSPSMNTTPEGRTVVGAFLGVVVGGLLTYEFVAGFYGPLRD
jgi:hypothetical protein